MTSVSSSAEPMTSETHTTFRGQYCFSARPITPPESFTSLALPDGSTFAAHTAVITAHLTDGSDYIILAGFCFDTDRPDDTPADIACRLFDTEETTLIDETASLVGRWIIIRKRGNASIAFADAAGTYPIVHTGARDTLLLASSSKLIEALRPGHAPSPMVTDRFRSLQNEPGRHAGQNLPLTVTSYAGIAALLPNHALDLNTGLPSRYFPRPAGYARRPAREQATVIAERMRKIVAAIGRHEPLALAATGGFDSRVIQAAITANAAVADRIDTFTFQYPHDPAGTDPDLVAMRQLAEITGLTFRVIPAEAENPGGDIRDTLAQSEEFFATGFAGWAEQAATEFAPGTLILMGWASEIARGFYRWPGSDRVTPAQLAGCGGVGGIAEMLPEFERWLPGAEAASQATGIPVLDLFYWENRVGRWCAPGLNILNTTSNWITPFSCRRLLDALLQTRETDRIGGRQTLYREIVAALNPDLLNVAINPVPLTVQVRNAVIGRLKSVKHSVRNAIKPQNA